MATGSQWHHGSRVTVNLLLTPVICFPHFMISATVAGIGVWATEVLLYRPLLCTEGFDWTFDPTAGHADTALERMESNIMAVLRHDMECIAAIHCLKVYCQRLGCDLSDGAAVRRAAGCAFALATEALSDMAILQFPPSLTAAAILVAARRAQVNPLSSHVTHLPPAHAHLTLFLCIGSSALCWPACEVCRSS